MTNSGGMPFIQVDVQMRVSVQLSLNAS